jgi:hypothetical protein
VARVILGRDAECERMSSLVEGGTIRASAPAPVRPSAAWGQGKKASPNRPNRGLEHLSSPNAVAASRRQGVGVLDRVVAQ